MKRISVLILALVTFMSYLAVASAASTPATNQAVPKCGDLSKFIGMHKQTIYDPTTDTVTIVAYDEQGQTLTGSFKLKGIRPEACPNQETAAYVAATKKNYEQVQALRCAALDKALSGKELCRRRTVRKCASLRHRSTMRNGVPTPRERN